MVRNSVIVFYVCHSRIEIKWPAHITEGSELLSTEPKVNRSLLDRMPQTCASQVEPPVLHIRFLVPANYPFPVAYFQAAEESRE